MMSTSASKRAAEQPCRDSHCSTSESGSGHESTSNPTKTSKSACRDSHCPTSIEKQGPTVLLKHESPTKPSPTSTHPSSTTGTTSTHLESSSGSGTHAVRGRGFKSPGEDVPEVTEPSDRDVMSAHRKHEHLVEKRKIARDAMLARKEEKGASVPSRDEVDYPRYRETSGKIDIQHKPVQSAEPQSTKVNTRKPNKPNVKAETAKMMSGSTSTRPEDVMKTL